MYLIGTQLFKYHQKFYRWKIQPALSVDYIISNLLDIMMKHQKGQNRPDHNHYTLMVAETLEKRVEYLRVLRAYIPALRIAATPEVR